ncbi:MAG: iron-containing alcohol dehydrogenase [Candidatus Thorarchaeota archaeon]
MKFDFVHTPDIKFGINQFDAIINIIKSFGSNPFFIVNKSVLNLEVVQKIIHLIENSIHSDSSSFFFIIKGEPQVEDIDSGVFQAINEKSDVIIAIGGGSALDAGKAIAGLMTNGGSAKDYLEIIGKGSTINKPSVPFIAVPTTSGTGSEVTKNAVIASKQDKYKASIRSPYLIPRVAIIDPLLMLSVPKDITARCGMDALTQLIEAYTSTNSQPITDSLAILGIKTIVRSFKQVYSDGENIFARTDMAFGALLGGICLANAGLGAVHGFASPIGAMFPIPHGTICAALLVPTICSNIKKTSDINLLQKYSNIASIFSSKTYDNHKVACNDLIKYLDDLMSYLNMQSLKDFDINNEAIPELIAKAKTSSSMKYNPVNLSKSDLSKILKDSIY